VGLAFIASDGSVKSSTVVRNTVAGTGDITFVAGGGIAANTATAQLAGTILALSRASGDPNNCRGRVDSQGHNVFGSTVGCAVTPMSSDITGKSPRLGSLGD